MKTTLTAALTCVITVTADACTVCDSGTGEAVRAGIFNSDFWSNLTMVMAPFLGTFAVLGLALGLPWGRASRKTQESNQPNSDI